LARVITVVDAVNGLETIKRHPEARKQIAVADQLVISKTDLLDGPASQLFEKLCDINPSVSQLHVSHGRLDAAALFPASGVEGPYTNGSGTNGSHAFDLLDGTAAQTGDTHAARHTHTHAIPHDDITTFAVVRERPIAAVALSLFLEALADHCGSDLLRLKGLVRIEEHQSQPAVIHGVQHVFHAPAWLDAWPSPDHRSRIVFIVRRISEAWVLALLDAIEQEVEEVQLRQVPTSDGTETRRKII
jgi:G3E family GTPase